MDASLTGLPIELIIYILNSDLTGTQVARSLIGSCKRFHAVAVPFLFRSVRLYSHDCAMKFFFAVFSQPSRAEHVRSLVMSLGRGFRRGTTQRQVLSIENSISLSKTGF
jgi:hypothetical protein